LSKSFMTGLRIGWLVASPRRIRSLTGLKRAMDLGCPPLMQGIALSLLSEGEYERHLSRAREHYKERRDAALEALKAHMPEGVTWTRAKEDFICGLNCRTVILALPCFFSLLSAAWRSFPGLCTTWTIVS
ncbi:aminotransferase class I/II-fold pyridoxal phosphate-dependent enzyme, partial [Candidatus Hydrogenedentota bacterium]